MNYERFSKFTVLLTTVAENFMNLLYNRIRMGYHICLTPF